MQLNDNLTKLTRKVNSSWCAVRTCVTWLITFSDWKKLRSYNWPVLSPFYLHLASGNKNTILNFTWLYKYYYTIGFRNSKFNSFRCIWTWSCSTWSVWQGVQVVVVMLSQTTSPNKPLYLIWLFHSKPLVDCKRCGYRLQFNVLQWKLRLKASSRGFSFRAACHAWDSGSLLPPHAASPLPSHGRFCVDAARGGGEGALGQWVSDYINVFLSSHV